MTRTGEPIYIFGAGGHAREILQILQDINTKSRKKRWRPLGILLDPGYSVATCKLPAELPVLVDPECWKTDTAVVIAVGQSAARQRIFGNLLTLGFNHFPTLVHPSAWLANSAHLGEGNIIFAGSMLNADITLGNHVHLNLACSISHDSVIGDFSTLGPGCRLCGNCFLATGVDLGANCTMIPHSRIGEWAIIGAGAVVRGEIPGHCTAVGVPASVIKLRTEK